MHDDPWWDSHEPDGYQGNGKAMLLMLLLIVAGVVGASVIVAAI